MHRDAAAAIIAYVFHPIPVAVAAVLVLFGASMPVPRAIGWAAVVLAVLFLPLIATIMVGRYTGRYETALLGREERHRMYSIATVTMAVATGGLWWSAAPRIVTMLSGIIAAYVLVAGVVNRSMKISVHAAAVTGSVVLVASVMPWLLLPGAAMVGGVCWARVHEGKHTRREVVAGVVVSTVVAAPMVLA